MILLPLAVMWAGYTLVWYGYSQIKGPGTGLLDVVLPNRHVKMDGIVKSWSGIGDFHPGGKAGGGDFPLPPSAYANGRGAK